MAQSAYAKVASLGKGSKGTGSVIFCSKQWDSSKGPSYADVQQVSAMFGCFSHTIKLPNYKLSKHQVTLSRGRKTSGGSNWLSVHAQSPKHPKMENKVCPLAAPKGHCS